MGGPEARLDLQQTEMAGLPELREVGAEKVTEHKLENAKEDVLPDGGALRTAAKSAAAAAAIGAAAAAARGISSRLQAGDES